ncbi:MAG: DNA polymerase III subunit beta [Bacillota bacterium]
MEFTINQKEMHQAIQIVQKAVASKQTMPILTGILIKTEDNNKLTFTATDMEIGIEHRITANIIENGAIVIPANYITNLVRELPDDKINFKADSEKFQAKIECLNSSFKLNGYDPKEFPQLPAVKTPSKFNLPTSTLKKQIKEIEFSTSNDETQPTLTGAYFSITDNNMTMVATNTYRLAYSKKNIDININPDEKIEVILPGKTLNELNRLLNGENTEILINSNYAKFQFENVTIISRLIEGKFPNYQQVMPNNFNTYLKVDKNTLNKAVKRASYIASINSNTIILKAENNKLVIDTANTEKGHAHEEIPIEKEGPDQQININAGYLLDGLKVLEDDEINIAMIDEINPLTVQKPDNDNYLYLIMPIRSD